MDSRVLYEASFVFQPAWLLMLLIGAVWVTGTILTLKSGKPPKGERRETPLWVFVVGLIFLAFVYIVVIPDQINMYNATVGAYHRGEYQIVEGYVEDYHPMPKEGHDQESFTINGVTFAYNDATLQFGYHKTKPRGGVITEDGQHLKIGYTNYKWLGNVIVYIEELP